MKPTLYEQIKDVTIALVMAAYGIILIAILPTIVLVSPYVHYHPQPAAQENISEYGCETSKAGTMCIEPSYGNQMVFPSQIKVGDCSVGQASSQAEAQMTADETGCPAYY